MARRRRWVGGIALSVVAAGAQILALTLAPLMVVQPADAAGLLLLLLVGSRPLGERIGRRELAAVVGIVVGIMMIVVARPARSTGHAGAGELAVGLVVVGAVAAAPYVVRGLARKQDLVVVFAAAFAFAAGAFSIKLLADALVSRAWLSLGLLAVVAAAAGALGVLSEQTALQRRQVTQVAPIIFVTELAVPLLLALTFGGESWGSRPFELCAVAGGLGLLVLSVVALLQTPAVSRLLGDEQQVLEGGPRPAIPGLAPLLV